MSHPSRMITEKCPRTMLSRRGRAHHLCGGDEMAKRSPEERFWAKVDRSRGPNACWVWMGSLATNGYGQFRVDGRLVRVHRFAYELLVGPIPEGAELDHDCHTRDRDCIGRCEHRRCVNPLHLIPMTHRENTQLGGLARATHCKREHEFTLSNTRRDSAGRRQCRACDAIRHPGRMERQRARRARRASARKQRGTT